MTSAPGYRPTAGTHELPNDVLAVSEYFYQRGCTDGLPVVPPTPEAVGRMLAWTDRAPDEVVARLAPRWGLATVEKIAINAVLAGCRPAYLPVLIAAVEALAAEEFNLYGIQATTHPVAPLLLVNGPIARELELNAGHNAFGPGNWANATIGRAIRLILLNIGGATPGELDKATQGQPSKYTYCLAENEEQNPWEPLHVERGLRPEDSAVTVIGAENPHNINDHESNTAQGICTTVAFTLAQVGSNNAKRRGEPGVFFGPEHAATVAGDGWDKQRVREFLWEHARNPLSRFSAENQAELAVRFPDQTPDTTFPPARSPEDFIIAVVGGAGKHSAAIFTFGSTRSVTRPIALSSGRPARSIQEFRRG
ncbi:MAG TPA: hypothetical protein VHL09_16895 [Dehalococcoidia bacterium]|nr:hypothetical protein [Dehalococcoidia bacterium]